MKLRSLGISVAMHCAGAGLLLLAPEKPVYMTPAFYPVQLLDSPALPPPRETSVRREPDRPVPPRPPRQEAIPPAAERPPAAEQPAPPRNTFSEEDYRRKLSRRLTDDWSLASRPAQAPERVERVQVPELESRRTMPSPVPDTLPGALSVNLPSQTPGSIPAWYLAAIRTAVKANWVLEGRPTLLSVLVSFRILRNGTIQNTAVERSSKNSWFDAAALDAVRKTRTLPPIPDEIRQNHLDVVIDFSMEDT